MDAHLTHDPMATTELSIGLALHGDFMDDSAFMEQLLHGSQSYCYTSNPYSTTAWSLPHESLVYGDSLQTDDTFTTASPLDCQSCITPLDPATEASDESSPLALLNRPPPLHISGLSVTNDLKSVIDQFPEPPTSASPVRTPSPEQPPRLRSAHSKRRSKYRRSKASSTASSDDESVSSSRPAHNKAERNYRRRLNSSFQKLLEVMNMVGPKDDVAQLDGEIGKDLSKGDLLHLASLRLIAMERENQRLRVQLEQMRSVPRRATSWPGVEPTGY